MQAGTMWSGAAAKGALALIATFALAGCGGTQQALGLVRTSPDEFAVVAKAPLVLPPDFGLRPPIPGAPPIVVAADPAAQAAAAINNAARLGLPLAGGAAAALGGAGRTLGETALLGAAGVAEAGIRARVDLEVQQLAEKNLGFVQALLAFQRPGEIINPAVEADRLRAAGQPTVGPLPTARRVGGGLFN